MNTSFGLLLYVLVHSTSPNFITKAPQFQLKVTLGSSNPLEARVFLRVDPTTKKEYPFSTQITNIDGSEQVIGKSVDQTGIYPIKTIEGDLYFEIKKTNTQRILASYLEIVA